MNRTQLEHIIRAAGEIAEDDELIVIGSQAILGPYPAAPQDLVVSMEADVFPKNKPENTPAIDGAIGELSSFHTQFGYYAHGVAEETATLPEGWKDRLVPVQNDNTKQVTGWCLDPHDLAVSKLAAGRAKDMDFVRGLLRHDMVDPVKLQGYVNRTNLSADQQQLITDRLTRLTT